MKSKIKGVTFMDNFFAGQRIAKLRKLKEMAS
jgi:hypothetical protein